MIRSPKDRRRVAVHSGSTVVVIMHEQRIEREVGFEEVRKFEY